VFDGHGGHKVSAYCAAKLPEKLKEAMPQTRTRTKITTTTTDIGPLVRNAILSLHHDVCDALSEEADACGTTALVAVQQAGRFCIAHCGDSRAVLCENNIARQLTVDHKPDVPEERDRILAAGGLVFRRHNHGQSMVMGLLAMSRALGDAYLDPYISHEPDVMTFECTPGMQFLLLASDGLFDVMDNQTAVELALQSLGHVGHVNSHVGHVDHLCSLDSPGNNNTNNNTSTSSNTCTPSNTPSNTTSNTTSNTSRAAKCQSAAGRLVLEAARRGATDNISVVVVDLTGMSRKNKHDSDSFAK
jgi:protein phosphatase 2C